MSKRNGSKPWDRQQGESSQAFAAFVAYLEMGTDRSIRAVTRKLHKSHTLIGRWSRTYNWVERVAAYDAELHRQAYIAARKKVDRMIDRHIRMALMLQDKALEELEEITPEDLDPKTMLSCIVTAVKLEREARDGSSALLRRMGMSARSGTPSLMRLQSPGRSGTTGNRQAKGAPALGRPHVVDMNLTRSLYHEGGSFSMGNQSISAIIQQVVDTTSPIPPNTVTAGARRAVERRLYDLPRLCEQLEQGDTQEAAEITREIDSIRRALQTISRDPYYPLIPAHYFRGLKERAAAEFCNCVKTTVFRNRTRLLDTLALRLFGVSAWDRTRNW